MNFRQHKWLAGTTIGGLILFLFLFLAGRYSFAIPQAPRDIWLPAHPIQSDSMQRTTAGSTASDSWQQTMNGRLDQLRQLQGPNSWAWHTGLPQHRLVVFYGNPLSAVMGPIGRYNDDELVSRMRHQAQEYTNLDPSHTVVPALDYVTPIAQPVPMADNTWRYRMPDASIEHYMNLANDHHMLFFMDMQIGHSTVQAEISHVWQYLQRPGVDLALDPEFDMPPGGIPSQVFGHMKADEINQAIDRLSQLVQEQHLPPKILIIHQFLEEMLPDWQNIKIRPGVEVVTSVDGFGAPGDKIGDYHMFNDLQRIQYPGIKLFYDLDKPLMSASDVLALKPSPLLVMYQ
jgi:hypothetical protein